MRLFAAVFLAFLLLPAPARALTPAEQAVAAHGMVASREAEATRIGVAVLRQGGNAVDAAVAVGFALAVTLPVAGNLGGGGFMLVHDAKSGETVAIDYRETAPAAAHRDMFLDAAGEADAEKSRQSHHAVGVPGTVAGLVAAQQRYGTWPLDRLLAPAIRLAEDGIVVGAPLAEALRAARERLARSAAGKAIFLKPDGAPLAEGERLVQADLAWSLRRIAERGAAAFYQGAIAERLIADMAAHGGPMRRGDLESYRAIVRPPLRGRYRGLEIASMPPPSSGGVHLLQMLNVLAHFPIPEMAPLGPERAHLLAEAMKRAYADRAEHLGDPAFWPVPARGLLSPRYAETIAANIDRGRARPSADIRPGAPAAYESDQTAHFAVMDGAGNAVSNTYTLNFAFGSGIVAAGTGILLNNEMDDFSAKPGAPNAYGLVGGEANAVAAGKRPLSSMTPVIVFKDGRPWLATGARGGGRIITAVLQQLVNLVDLKLDLATATSLPRLHHQWLPDRLYLEPGFPAATQARLRSLGHTLAETREIGSLNAVMRLDNGFAGIADPRRPGGLAMGH